MRSTRLHMSPILQSTEAEMPLRQQRETNETNLLEGLASLLSVSVPFFCSPGRYQSRSYPHSSTELPVHRTGRHGLRGTAESDVANPVQVQRWWSLRVYYWRHSIWLA